MESLIITTEMSCQKEQKDDLGILFYGLSEGTRMEYILDSVPEIERMMDEFVELGCFIYHDFDSGKDRAIKPSRIMVGEMTQRIRRRVRQKSEEQTMCHI